jgi:DNA-binding LacI/PurR family transcriptional regulator
VATIRAVANEADVSIATVSRVLNNTGAVSADVRERVLEVAGRLRYGAARRSMTNYIALAYTGPSTLASPYDGAILEGVNEAAEAAGFDLVITQIKQERRSNETAMQLLARKEIRGALLRTTNDTRYVCTELAKDGFPSIVVGDCFNEEPEVSYVYGDSRPTSYQAVDHLISLGHRRIAVVISQVADHDHQDRLLGYEQALKEHAIDIDPRLVHRVIAHRPDGAQVIRTLMSLTDRPTAIFVADPLVAVGAINQAHEMGIKIPDDVSIMGFDDTDTRHNVYPKMSAICQDAHQLGFEAAKALTQRLLDDADTAVRMAYPTWMELHGTVGRPPAVATRVLPDGSRMDDGGEVTDRARADE